MADPSNPALDVSPEEEAFLHDTFRRHARSYLAVSVFALGLAIAGLGFGLTNASASDVDAEALRAHHGDQRARVEAMRLEVEAHIEATTALATRLDALEARLVDFEATPTPLETRVDDAHRRLRSLEQKQGITASSPTAPGLYKRLNALEARLSVIELERG